MDLKRDTLASTFAFIFVNLYIRYVTPFAVFMLLAIAVAAAGLLCAYNTYVGAKVLEKNPDLLKLASGQKPGMMYRFKRMMILGGAVQVEFSLPIA